MKPGDFVPFEQKMRAAGVMEAAIGAFRHNYEALCREETGLIPESSILPVERLGYFEPGVEAFDPVLLSQVVVIKLNGGLGTSMGLQKVKSVLEVRPGVNFLDLIVRQVKSLREAGVEGPRLLLMNSFSTSADTLEYLGKYAADGFAEASEVELMQNQVPKIDESSLAPVEWPSHPDHEWCPPGHGDLYPALIGSGWLDRLLAEGVRYAFVSNSDNLGAVLEPGLLKYFAESDAPFLMEVTRRTPADRKGGHLAVRAEDGRLLLREVAQCPDADLDAFQDIDRHRYFNTNSIWLRLDLLKERLAQSGGVLPLPMIRNRKTVDPRDKASTPVIQLEVAMGAAIECFEGSQAIEVPRSRFAPVKSTADLFALRSDAYRVGGDGRVGLVEERHGQPPVVKLDEAYKLVDAIESLGSPSLAACDELVIDGPLRFADGVILKGKVAFSAPAGEFRTVPAGTYADGVFPL
ncbi:MAG: UTP--glucose-1-phosphate uridylyltransferase [Verrucomicrobia bacterium]|nr:MAG: UTP--glucose-1-phosphate uridylyltransferase [Verrucomicrobiota bacterium]TAE88201.1 MAG: UTP--glucose-1-phosphate uridylyltransferase [Verrucomicrobiota bacterium]TAF26085.1 MAG: UTP--glucose-1-phosphate uridylyltransferase [Verrucomicrobiota bacterium]TAF40990.1 MAG: UTP--glucose-1-phosphate uridylyltransferase [Verrucomicrobiota bacterium]